ncbi:MAG: HAD-IIIA family hydrolase [candidate division FCPU426 bacterium]
MPRAVFLDRDGVLNRLVFNPVTKRHESPHVPQDFALLPGVLDEVERLQAAGYMLFLVSNQPSYALGKTTMENIRAIHQLLETAFQARGIRFQEYYYCFHHPEGVVPDYTADCECRKPKPYFILKARDEFDLDLGKCWLVGDQDSDVLCGRASGVRTILVAEPDSAARRGQSEPDFHAATLGRAVDIILEDGGTA